MVQVTRDLIDSLLPELHIKAQDLRRPTFELFHRLVVEILDATGFPEGLFEDRELELEKLQVAHACQFVLILAQEFLLRLQSVCQQDIDRG